LHSIHSTTLNLLIDAFMAMFSDSVINDCLC